MICLIRYELGIPKVAQITDENADVCIRTLPLSRKAMQAIDNGTVTGHQIRPAICTPDGWDIQHFPNK